MTWCLEGFQTAIHLRGCMDEIYLARDVCAFHATVTIQCRELEPTCSRFHYHAHQRLHSIRFPCETDGKTFFITSIFFLFFCILLIHLTNNIFILQARFLNASQARWIFCWNTHVEWWLPKIGSTVRRYIAELNTLWYVGFQQAFSLQHTHILKV